jgi:DNA (cytosine-5)-methyltransferase 1
MMKVLSLFSGGGLGDYGLELAGMEIIGQVEIDDYCQKILKLRWPDVPKWGDIKSVKGEEVIERCGRIDLVSGGFPCQDISTAGKGAGITGERSGLWKEMFRIICEARPRFVLVENVSALLGRGLGTVLGDLAEVGYDCEWDCIPASAVGAPHQRDRVWVVGYTGSEGLEGRKRGISEGQGLTEPNKEVADSKIIKRESSRLSMRKEQSNSRFRDSCENGRIFAPIGESRRSWPSEPNVGRVANGVAKRVDRLKCLGNGQVVQVVQWIGERIMQFESDSPKALH